MYLTDISSINKKVYEYNLKNRKLKIIIESNDAFLSSVTALNNKIYFADRGGVIYEYTPLELYDYNIINMEKIVKLGIYVVYHRHFRDCNKTRKNNKIYNLKYKNIIKNNTYINKNYKIDTLKNSLNKTL